MDFIGKLLQYIDQGGFVMPFLVVATAALWFALGHRWAILSRGNKRDVRSLLWKYSTGYKREPSGLIDTAIVAGLEIARRGGNEMRNHLDECFAPFEQESRKFALVVRSIVIVAPLAGLLGTVDGMIETFGSLGDMTLFSQSGGIAGGISQALISTQMGLAVAIPGSIVGRLLDRRQATINRELEQIKDLLCSGEIPLTEEEKNEISAEKG